MFYSLLIILLLSLSKPIFASSFCKFNISDDYFRNEGNITLHCLLPPKSQCSWKRGANFIQISGRYQYLNGTPKGHSDDHLFDCSIVINQPSAIDKDVFACEALKTMDDNNNSMSSQCSIEYEPIITVTTPTDSAYQNSSPLPPREFENVDSDLKTICSLAFKSEKNGQLFLVLLGLAVFSAGVIVGAIVVLATKKICRKPKPCKQPIKFENRTYFDPKCDIIIRSKSENR